jgi:hypothetical protein
VTVTVPQALPPLSFSILLAPVLGRLKSSILLKIQQLPTAVDLGDSSPVEVLRAGVDIWRQEDSESRLALLSCHSGTSRESRNGGADQSVTVRHGQHRDPHDLGREVTLP